RREHLSRRDRERPPRPPRDRRGRRDRRARPPLGRDGQGGGRAPARRGGDRRGHHRLRARADRRVQGAQVGGLRGGAAADAERQAEEGRAPRAVLEGPRAPGELMGADRSDHAQQLRRALLAIAKTEARIEELEQREAARREPIAVVGLGCRFPGAATPAEYWSNLIGGVDCIREVPRERWDSAALFDPDPDAAGKMTTRWGGFLDGIDQFDPAFFGVSPREAARMDPQQRLALEVAWEALEDAAIVPAELAGGAVG